MAMNNDNQNPRCLKMTHPGIYQDETNEKWVAFMTCKPQRFFRKALFWKTDEIPAGYSVNPDKGPKCLNLDLEHEKYTDEEGAIWDIVYFGSGIGITTLVLQTTKTEE